MIYRFVLEAARRSKSLNYFKSVFFVSQLFKNCYQLSLEILNSSTLYIKIARRWGPEVSWDTTNVYLLNANFV